ncbi:MAG: hypothetical protein K8E66_05770, partial [Phycisphaerales bacterium]|nr:hypothetical protein [Phycisphaerales bacterium]
MIHHHRWAAVLLLLLVTPVASAWEADYGYFIRENARLDLSTGALDVAGEGDHLYVATRSGFLVVDISNPQVPAIVGQGAPGDWLRRVTVRDEVLYVSQVGGGVSLYDVSQPDAPQFISTLSVPTDPHGIALAPATGPVEAMFVAGTSRVYCVDVSDPAAPAIQAELVSPGNDQAKDAAYGSGYLYVAYEGIGESWVIDVSDLKNPVQVGTLSAASRLLIDGNRLYASTSADLQTYALTDPVNPAFLGEASVGPDISGFAPHGGWVFTAAGCRGLLTVNPVADPVVGGVPCRARGSATSVVILDGRAFVSATGDSDTWGTIQVVDLTVPLSPTLISFEG